MTAIKEIKCISEIKNIDKIKNIGIGVSVYKKSLSATVKYCVFYLFMNWFTICIVTLLVQLSSIPLAEIRFISAVVIQLFI